MVPSSSDVADWLVDKVFDQLRRVFVCCAAQAKLTVSTVAEAVKTASGSQNERMVAAGADLCDGRFDFSHFEDVHRGIVVAWREKHLVGHIDQRWTVLSLLVARA